MTRAFAVATFFFGSFCIAIMAIAAISMSTRVSADEPRYRLDARYHHLPPKLVAELLAHPPQRSRSWIDSECREDDIDGEKVDYCICYGAKACAAAPKLASGRENWECTGPLGIIDESGTGVCRAELRSITVIGG